MKRNYNKPSSVLDNHKYINPKSNIYNIKGTFMQIDPGVDSLSNVIPFRSGHPESLKSIIHNNPHKQEYNTNGCKSCGS
jgi:hypothetical protein